MIFIILYILLSFAVGLVTAYIDADADKGLMMTVIWPIVLPLMLIMKPFNKAAKLKRKKFYD